MRNTAFLIVLSVLVCCVFGCTSKHGTPDTVTLVLEENPTTGFRWEIETDGEVLKLESDTYQPAQVEKGIVGAGGTRTFVFSVLQKKECLIHCRYYRHWEGKPSQDTKTYRWNGKTLEEI